MYIRLKDILCLICLVLTLCAIGQSNEGRDFWFGFMEHRDKGENTMVVMISSRSTTTGSISIPKQGYQTDFSVNANDVTVIQLPNYVETIGSEYTNDNGIHISSSADVSVYIHQYFGMRSEASVVLPSVSLGNAYYVMSFTGVSDNFGGGPYPSEFLIVASEDETNITYKLAGDTQNGKKKGTSHNLILSKGEVHQIRSNDWLTDLTGTYVSGDKDFAVFAGTPWSQVPVNCTAMDNLLEQMYPVSTWGTRYVASPFYGTSDDLYRIIAAEHNTNVRIEGTRTENIILNAGEYFDYSSSQGSYIESDRPISVAQFIKGNNCNGGVGDPSMVILNTVQQIRDTVTLFNSVFFAIDQNYINVICKKDEEDLIFIDNQKVVDLGISFTAIGEEGLFLFATINTSVGAHTLFTEGCGIIAMAYGYGNIESYAYSGGASFIDINENPIPEGGCLNDTILFSSGLPPDRYHVEWDLGDGTSTTEHEFEHSYPDLGTYPLSVIIEDICFDDIDTLYQDIQISLRQDISVGDDQSGCEGTDITLSAFDLEGARFEWMGPNDFAAEEQFPLLQNIESENGGIYEVVGNISGCKTIPKEVALEVFINPSPDLGQDVVLCAIDGDQIELTIEDYQSYIWQDATHESTYIISSEGMYYVEVMDNNDCMGRDTIIAKEQCPTRIYIPNIFTPNDDGINDFFGVSEIEILSMHLSVYDRWGKLVFESQDADNKWAGMHSSSPVTVGQYAWVLKYEGYKKDASIFKAIKSGTILLMR